MMWKSRFENWNWQTLYRKSPKIKEYVRQVQQKMDSTSYLIAMHMNGSERRFFGNIDAKYPNISNPSQANKTLFLFNNADPFVCNKLGYFVFEAFQLRKEKPHNSIYYWIKKLTLFSFSVIVENLVISIFFFVFIGSAAYLWQIDLTRKGCLFCFHKQVCKAIAVWIYLVPRNNSWAVHKQEKKNRCSTSLIQKVPASSKHKSENHFRSECTEFAIRAFQIQYILCQDHLDVKSRFRFAKKRQNQLLDQQFGFEYFLKSTNIKKPEAYCFFSILIGSKKCFTTSCLCFSIKTRFVFRRVSYNI